MRRPKTILLSAFVALAACAAAMSGGSAAN